jgi:hypothetical protein
LRLQVDLRFIQELPGHKSSKTDEPGECADIFRKLSQVGIEVNESIGIADIYDSYIVVLYLQQEDCEKAIAAWKE